jgi:hypothetical protein
MIELPESSLRKNLIYFEGRSIGLPGKGRILARNISPEDKPPDWRVTERELIRWFRTKGFKYYERGVFTH